MVTAAGTSLEHGFLPCSGPRLPQDGVFSIAGWGIGVIMNAWDVYGRQEITEEDIHREMDRLGK